MLFKPFGVDWDKKKIFTFLGQNGCQEKLSQILMDRNGLQASLVTPLGPAEKLQAGGQKSWQAWAAGLLTAARNFVLPLKCVPLPRLLFHLYGDYVWSSDVVRVVKAALGEGLTGVGPCAPAL